MFDLMMILLWCAPAPIQSEPLAACVADSCIVDYDCATQWGRWACHCCVSTPGKQQASLQVCNVGPAPAECGK